MKTRFLVFVSMLLLTLSANVFAVGLGDIVMQSGLNEPLKARIPLIKTGDLTDVQIVASLGSAAEFEKHHLSRDMFYTTIRFTVDMKNPAGPSILLSSESLVKEPSMDFLVAVAWPTGRLVRGYTVLLEKP